MSIETDKGEPLIGLQRGAVRVVPYNPIWKQCFEEEKILLDHLLQKDAVNVQHVGSTAVPGLSAKPIIDIMVGVENLTDGLKYVEALEEHRYEFRGDAGIPGRLFFAKGSPEFRTHHLHMVQYRSEFWVNHLLFRDYLITYGDAAKEYERIKTELANQYESDRMAYTDGKSDFIQSILCRAREESILHMSFDGYFMKRLTAEDENSLQELCGRCSDYYTVVEGRSPSKDAAHEILTELPPNKEYKDKFVVGVCNQNAELVGVIDVVRDYPEMGEWMIGLLMIDPAERNNGLGRRIHRHLVEGVSRLKGDKLRIGVVEDNHGAYCFWRKLGYEEIKRVNMKVGDKENVVIVMNYKLKILYKSRK